MEAMSQNDERRVVRSGYIAIQNLINGTILFMDEMNRLSFVNSYFVYYPLICLFIFFKYFTVVERRDDIARADSNKFMSIIHEVEGLHQLGIY